MPNALRRALSVLTCLAAALTSGCSMLRLGYEQADHLAAWRAAQYFDLDAAQQDAFSARFARFHAWHRRQQLPDYAQFLTAVRQRAQRGPAREDAVWLVEGVRARYHALALRGSADAAAVLATLTDDNIRALQRRWQHDNRRFVREHRLEGSDEERRRAGAERALKQIREWTGGLSPEQEARIAALHAEIPYVQHLRHQDRLRRQREFLQLLDMRGGGREFEEKLRDWLVHWDRGRAPEYERLQALAYEKRIDFYLAVERLLTPRQRAAVLDRLQGFIDDFQRLAGHGGQVAGSR